MISKLFRRLSTALVAVALIGFVSAVSAMTLRHVVQHTVCTNPLVLEWTKIKRASDETVKIARSRYYPVLDFDASIGRERTTSSNTRTAIDIPNVVGSKRDSRNLWRRELGLRLRQNVFEGFTTVYEVKRNKAKTDADAFQVVGEAEYQALLATEAYINILRHRERLTIARQNLDTHQRMFNMIKERSESGVGREADISQATGRLALAQSDMYRIQNDLRNSETNFKRVTGLDPKELVKPASPSDSLIPRTLNDALYKGLRDHPKMHVAIVDVEEARAQHNVAHATAFPVVDIILEANNDHNISGTSGPTNSYLAMLQLNYNLFRGGADLARQHETAFLTQQAAEIRNRTCRETKEAVGLAWNTLTTAKKRLPTLHKHKVASRTTAVAYHDQFRLAKRTLLDLLDSEQERFNAALEYVDGQYEILIGKYRLIQAMGQLTAYLQVNLPEEGKADYGFYHAEANPINVARHIDAQIPKTDHPASMYHSEHPPTPHQTSHVIEHQGKRITQSHHHPRAGQHKRQFETHNDGHVNHSQAAVAPVQQASNQSTPKPKSSLFGWFKHHDTTTTTQRNNHQQVARWGSKHKSTTDQQAQSKVVSTTVTQFESAPKKVAKARLHKVKHASAKVAESSQSAATDQGLQYQTAFNQMHPVSQKPSSHQRHHRARQTRSNSDSTFKMHVLKEAEGLSTQVPSSQAKPTQTIASNEPVIDRSEVKRSFYTGERHYDPADNFDEQELSQQESLKLAESAKLKVASQATESTQTKPVSRHLKSIAKAKHQAKEKASVVAHAKQQVIKSGPELKGWAVQIGTFKDQKDVNNLVVKLRDNGMNGFMREIQTHHGRTFEVFVGPTKQRADASKLVRQLGEINLGGSIVRADI